MMSACVMLKQWKYLAMCSIASHVHNRLHKCRQSFYGLNSISMPYPGAAREVQAHLYKTLCQPVLTYGMECTSNSKDQFRRMESIQGRLIKQCLGLSKRSHNSAVLKALNIDKVQHIVNINELNLYHRIFIIECPARNLMQFSLARYITYDTQVHGTLLDRVVSIGNLKCVLRNYVDHNSEGHYASPPNDANGKYIDIFCHDKYAFISFYICIISYSFNYSRCTIL